MKGIVVCISGFGSNLQALIDACHSSDIPGVIHLVVSNKKSAYGLERARRANIPTFVSPDVYEIFSRIQEFNPDLVALAGFMKIIPPDIVQRFKNKIINIHPSLLPAYPGIHSIERAFQAGEKETGVTVHYVDEGVDTGPIIAQRRIPIESHDTLETLESKVHLVEHQLYVAVVKKLLTETVR